MKKSSEDLRKVITIVLFVFNIISIYSIKFNIRVNITEISCNWNNNSYKFCPPTKIE